MWRLCDCDTLGTHSIHLKIMLTLRMFLPHTCFLITSSQQSHIILNSNSTEFNLQLKCCFNLVSFSQLPSIMQTKISHMLSHVMCTKVACGSSSSSVAQKLVVLCWGNTSNGARLYAVFMLLLSTCDHHYCEMLTTHRQKFGVCQPICLARHLGLPFCPNTPINLAAPLPWGKKQNRRGSFISCGD